MNQYGTAEVCKVIYQLRTCLVVCKCCSCGM